MVLAWPLILRLLEASQRDAQDRVCASPSHMFPRQMRSRGRSVVPPPKPCAPCTVCPTCTHIPFLLASIEHHDATTSNASNVLTLSDKTRLLAVILGHSPFVEHF